MNTTVIPKIRMTEWWIAIKIIVFAIISTQLSRCEQLEGPLNGNKNLQQQVIEDNDLLNEEFMLYTPNRQHKMKYNNDISFDRLKSVNEFAPNRPVFVTMMDEDNKMFDSVFGEKQNVRTPQRHNDAELAKSVRNILPYLLDVKGREKLIEHSLPAYGVESSREDGIQRNTKRHLKDSSAGFQKTEARNMMRALINLRRYRK